MEELVIKIGEMLDEKIETKISEMLDEKIETKMSKMLDEKIETKINPTLDEIKQEMVSLDDKVENLREDMLDKFFLFEKEYGDKIISMGDYILVDKDKNEIRNKQIVKLENRMERAEANIFACQNDVFKVQQKVK